MIRSTIEELNKEVVRGYLERGFEGAGRGDKTALASYFDANYENRTSRHHDKAAQGLEGVAGYAQEVMRAEKEFKIKVDRFLAEGDIVASHWRMQGVHHAAHKLAHLGNVAATGKDLQASGLSLFRVEDGKIVEGWIYDNVLAALMEIKAIPAPG